MATTDHPAFAQPEDQDARVWRYMGLAKFLSLVSTSALFFSRADLLGDPYEGSISHFNRVLRPLVYKDRIPVESLDAMAPLQELTRQWTFVNCWHLNQVESAAMWRLYARTEEAVAVQTTYSRLASCLPDAIHLGAVKYIDYETEWLPEGNSFHPFMHKRSSFAHENEVRAITMDLPTRDGRIDWQPNSESGRSIDVKLHDLVERMYVAPTCAPWFRDLVSELLSKYELDVELAVSSLDRPPSF